MRRYAVLDVWHLPTRIFANEILKNGRIDPKHVCLTCGKCGDLIRAHKPTGCVIRDAKTFMPFYKEFLEIKKTQPANFRG